MEKRLQTLKLPRDLTLGGTKPVKKTYVPNLNVVRNKEKAKEVAAKNGLKPREKFRDKKFNKKQNETNGRFVQSSGIFSEGTTSDVLKKVYHSDRLGARDDTPTSMAVPTIKKETTPINEKAENIVLEELMACEEQNEDDEKFLPFAPMNWNEKDFKESKVPVKLEIKTEVEETDTSKKLKLASSILNCIPEEYEDNVNISDYNPILTLWGLPDSFAGKSFIENAENKELSDYRLNDMLDGQIGKLVIRKSGKIEVCIGCVKYNLDQTELQSFTEEIVEINSQENQESMQSAVLGKVRTRFILNPDWEHLLDNC